MAMKKSALFAILILVNCWGASGAWAQDNQRFGSVHKIVGTVVASDTVGSRRRELKQGDPVFVGEQIRSSINSEAVLKTDDAGVIAVRPNATFVMERFTANGDANDQFSMRIISGALRMITGWTGFFNKDRHRIITPSATVGIRGTDHEPYVLSAEMSSDLRVPEGTYNKVNKGGTVLGINGANLDIDTGRVGFAPARPPGRSRALITALTPTLLDRVPGFFVAGSFDAELESLVPTDFNEAIRARNASQPGTGTPAPVLPGTTQGAPGTASASGTSSEPPIVAPAVMGSASSEATGETATCKPAAIAAAWLKNLDNSVQQKNARVFMAQFDAQVRVVAYVRGANGEMTQVSFSRDEMARSTTTSFSQISDYTSRRPVVKAKVASDARLGQCDRVEIETVVLESGIRSGGSFRTETLETYKLVRRAGRWLATEASTTQK